MPAFGSPSSRLAIVGLAPGMRGANRTGRPFTGDFAGQLLYETLLDFGFAEGLYDARENDGLVLRDCRIVNAARCVPPENKPTPLEIRTCVTAFLAPALAASPDLTTILALGRIAHDGALRALGLPIASTPFRHGASRLLTPPASRPVTLFDSYHCSRYNTNTGVLTREMFRAVFANIRSHLDAAP